MENLTEKQSKPFKIWPERFLGPPPGLKEINLFCWAFFILCFLLPGGIVLSMQIKNGTPFFRKSVDFVYFYGIGQIANTHQLIDLYNFDVQLKTFNTILPLHEGTYGPSPYPPFVAEFFRPFTRLPFLGAYFLWLGISLTLYVSAVVIALREFVPGSRLERSLILCLALASSSFLLNTFGNGQLSSVALFFLVTAIMQERRSRPFAGGMALSVLSYKPPLLFLIIPMLLVTRRWKMLAGFATGEGILVLIPTILGGIQIWPAYFRFVNSFGHTSGVYGTTTMRLWKYVDFNALSYAIPGGRSHLGLMLLAGVALCVISLTALLFWKTTKHDVPAQLLAWTVALNWNMLLNIYYPIYDSILFVVVVILVVSALRGLRWGRALQGMVFLSVLIFAVGWITEPIAKSHGVQLLTLGLLAFAIAQTWLLWRALAPLPVTPNSATALG